MWTFASVVTKVTPNICGSTTRSITPVFVCPLLKLNHNAPVQQHLISVTSRMTRRASSAQVRHFSTYPFAIFPEITDMDEDMPSHKSRSKTTPLSINAQVLEHVTRLRDRHQRLTQDMMSGDISSGGKKFSNLLGKELKWLTRVSDAHEEYLKASEEVENLRQVINNEKEDPDLRDLAKEELGQAIEGKLKPRERKLIMTLLKGKHFIEMQQEAAAAAAANSNNSNATTNTALMMGPSNSSNAILEIRPGVGGDEATLFCMDLLTMYQNYAQKKGWTFELVEFQSTGAGGCKGAIANVSSNMKESEDDENEDTVNLSHVYGSLRYESGVHRVQRVPITDSYGRIHTSTATVAILPEVKEIDVQINPVDIRIDTMRASGAGGQHVNVTDSAVRLTHMPSGIVVTISDERSQHRNKDKAMRILRSRLYEIQKEEYDKKRNSSRSEQIGMGDRSEKIRTYNYPQDRVTDHRAHVSQFGVGAMMNGDYLDMFITELKLLDNLNTFRNLFEREEEASKASSASSKQQKNNKRK